jgi:hypothetical protein
MNQPAYSMYNSDQKQSINNVTFRSLLVAVALYIVAKNLQTHQESTLSLPMNDAEYLSQIRSIKKISIIG